MKQFMKFLCSLMLIALPLFGDEWNSTITSQSTSASYTTLDNVANKDGIHVVRIESGSPNTLTYQLLNSAGTLIRTSTIDNGVSNSPVIVSGTDFNLYAVYVKGTQVVVKQSTDIGQNWTNTIQNTKDFEAGHTTGYGIDAVMDGSGKIHIVYSTKGQYTSSEVFYRNYEPNSGVWANFKNVTDQASLNYGRDPAIALSSGKVHVTCTMTESSGGTLYSRDRVIADDSWETPILVHPSNQSGFLSSVISDNTNVYVLYVRVSGGGQLVTHLMFSKRSINGSSWEAPTQLAAPVERAYPPRIVKTADGNIFAFYITGDVYYRKYYNSTWETAVNLSNDQLSEYNVTAYNVGNDIFVNWMAWLIPNHQLKYRQYDAAPTKSQNMAITTYGGGKFSPPHAQVSWNANPEPDMSLYEIYRAAGSSGFGLLTTGPSTQTYYNDAAVNVGSGGLTVYYKIKAKDVQNLLSIFSDEVSIASSNFFEKRQIQTEEIPDKMEISQNYPNPFNPSTKISYSVPEISNVKLSVYDRLGREIATVVNREHQVGYYEANFDASTLASGVYFYTIKAGKYFATRKMTLMK